MLAESDALLKKEQPSQVFSRLKAAGRYLLYGLALIPAFLMLTWLVRFAVNMPILDEWQFAHRIIHLRTGQLTFNELWTANNGHRMFVAELLLVGLNSFGPWDIRLGNFVNLLIHTLTLVVFWRLLAFSAKTRYQPLLLLGVSGLLFSTARYEDWMMGFDIGWFLINLCVVAMVWLLFSRPGRWLTFLACLGLATVATYSAGPGVPIWPVGFVGLLARRRRWKTPYLLAWVGACLVVMVLYFTDYQNTFDSPGLVYISNHLPDFVAFFLAYLGAPLTFWTTTQVAPIVNITGAVGLAAVVSGVGLVLLAGSGFWLWHNKLKWQATGWDNGLPWLLLAFFGLLNAGETAYGRIGFGVGQAFTSRYTGFATLFWIGLLVVFFLAARQLYAQLKPRRRPLLYLALAALGLVAIGNYSASYLKGYEGLQSWHRSMSATIPFFYSLDTTPDEVLLTLFPNAADLRKLARSLESLNDWIYAPAYRQTYNEQVKQLMDRLESGTGKIATLPNGAITMVLGNRQSVKYGPDNTFSFQQEGTGGLNLYVNGTGANPVVDFGVKNAFLDIQLNYGGYLRVYWDTGQGVNGREMDVLAAQVDKDGRKHFVAPVPENVKAVRIDIFYNSPTPVRDSLKIDLYQDRR